MTMFKSPAQETRIPQILVVDDNLSGLDLMRHILEETYRVVCVATGEEALELLAREDFDAVLLDVMLPGMDGLQVLEAIRRAPRTSDLPVILISALQASDEIVRGLQMGASDYLTKPSDVSVVQARVGAQVALKRLMDDYKRVIAELEAAHHMRERLFRIASHDLKAPLANIRMAEHILRDCVGDDAEGRQTLDTLAMTVDMMECVIEEFLDFAAFERGRIQLQPAAVSVDDTVTGVAVQYSVAAANKDIQLELGSLPGCVLADPARLAQIVGNLVSNAVKYSPKGSSVSLWSEVGDRAVRIYVADQGPGIPAEERHLLFKEFSRLSTRPTGNESSTGLGLWIVNQLVTMHNGSVGVDCPPDGGSVFWVEIPVAAPE